MANSSRRLLLALLLGLLGLGCASDSPPSSETSDRVEPPAFLATDVVITIDHSTVGLLASGIDVDGDGVVGRNREWVRDSQPGPSPAWSWTTDSGDTREALQLEVARALVPRLAERQNRVGLASFTLRAWSYGTSVVRHIDKPSVIVPVGSPDAVLDVLADFPPIRERRRTDLARLLDLAAGLLDEASPQEDTRPRVILLLSLGEPSAPDGVYWSSRRAVEFAGSLGERGIEVWAIPIGRANDTYLQELTRAGGGKVIALQNLDAMFEAP